MADTTEKSKKESVIESLMSRLQSNVPLGEPRPFPVLGNAGSLEIRLKALEDANNAIKKELEAWPDKMKDKMVTDAQDMEKKIEETILDVPAEAPAETPALEPPPVITSVMADETRDAAVQYLQQIVDAFNENIEHWYKSTGCVANFSWEYLDRKKLAIAGVDFILYRKKAPSGTTVKEILERKPAPSNPL